MKRRNFSPKGIKLDSRHTEIFTMSLLQQVLADFSFCFQEKKEKEEDQADQLVRLGASSTQVLFCSTSLCDSVE